MIAPPSNSVEALRWLASHGAHAWLVRHHELVVETASELCDRLVRELGLDLHVEHVLLGAALHDAGKIEHPDEMSAPGSQHERTGEALLLREGLDPRIARVCVTHAAWDESRARLEDRVIALADKLWKGKRDETLERALLTEIAARVGRPAWDVFDTLDRICADIASAGPERLARSNV